MFTFDASLGESAQPVDCGKMQSLQMMNLGRRASALSWTEKKWSSHSLTIPAMKCRYGQEDLTRANIYLNFQVENMVETYAPHACVVLYSIEGIAANLVNGPKMVQKLLEDNC